MSAGRRQLLATHRSELAGRIDALGRHVAEHGADAGCASLAHALRGAALTLGLDVVAVAAAAIEAACDAAGGDVASARRAVEVARRDLAGAGELDARARHDLRGELNIVVGHASLLELEPLTRRQSASVAEILAAADGITSVLNGLEGVGADGAVAAGPAPSRAARVLVVEDDAPTGRALERMLDELGATATVVRTAADALRAAALAAPDLVLLDLGLPDGDGREVLRTLRETPALARLPVVVSSGAAGAALGRELAARGATAILPKPVTLEALRNLLGGL